MTVKRKAIQQVFDHVSLGAPERAIGFVLWKAFHLYQREIDKALAPLDLTHLQFTTLTLIAWLARDEAHITQTDVARYSDIHKVQLSQMLKALEQKGLVVRTLSAVDVRAKNIALTAKGLERVEEALPLVIDVQLRLFGVAGKPGGSLLKCFHSMMRRMERESTTGDAPSDPIE